MAEKGVLLIAMGGNYAQWAANMAASIRHHNPGLPIALAVDAKADSFIFSHEREKLYDYIIPLSEDQYTAAGKLAPGLAKLNIYEISPFEKTIYLDVDGLTIKPLAGLFDLCEGKDVASQVNTVSTEKDETWPCQWMSLSDTRRVYSLGVSFLLPEINSSFMYWEKGDKAKSFFETAKTCFIPEYRTTWGSSFPDELAFNVAAARTETDLAAPGLSNGPVVFRMEPGQNDISQLPANIYVLGLYGSRSPQFAKTYQQYDRYSNKYFVSVLGITCPYKQGQLMATKFVLGGRPLLGKTFNVPDVHLPPVEKKSTPSKQDLDDSTPVKKATGPKKRKEAKA